ncbi:MAG: pirin family protein [Candidatus Marinimicrobia bacterium]|nr:pirin family protein [Candidatus Neomarinimicrobiota bacterium]
MIKKYKKIKAEDLYYLEASDTHPANTYFHFSFANYYDPKNMNFGVLRVINDDNVKPNSGFGTHPHHDMEIFSYIVAGKLTHRDSVGNHEVLSRGHVQCISAGTGLTHSELNEQNDWCRFLQIWILPEAKHLPIRYNLHKFSFEDRNNKLLQIISGSKNKDLAPLYICQDINVYVSELTVKDKGISFILKEGRQAYIFCFEGSININQYPSLKERDSLKIYGQANMEFTLTSDKAHFIIIEMKQETSD